MNLKLSKQIGLSLCFAVLIAVLAKNTDNVVATWLQNTPVPTTDPQSCRTSTGLMNSIALSPDGMSVLTNWNPGEARLWDIQSGKVIKTFFTDPGADSSYTNVAFSPDGNLIAIAVPLKATVWDVHTGELLHTFPRDFEEVIETRVTFSKDSQYLFTSGSDGASLWEVESGQKMFSFPALQEIALQQRAYLSPNDQYVLTADYTSNQVILWDAKNGQKVHAFDKAVNATFTPDAKGILAWGEYEGVYQLILWDIQTFQPLQNFGRFVSPRWKTSPDSRYLLVRGPNFTLWDMQTGELLDEFPFGYTYEFFPNNQQILINFEAQHNDGVTHDFYIWDIAARRVVVQLDIFSAFDIDIYDPVVSADEQYLVIGTRMGELYLWNLVTNKVERQFC